MYNLFDNEKSLQFQAIKRLETEGITDNDWYKWKLYNNEAYDSFISQASISIEIAITQYKESIKKHR